MYKRLLEIFALAGFARDKLLLDKCVPLRSILCSKCKYSTTLKRKSKRTVKSNFSVLKGFIFAALSGAFESTTAVIVKQVTNLHPAQLVLYRFIGIFLFSLPEAIKSNENILGPKDFRFMILTRSLSSATHAFLCFLAFRYLPIGEATVILFSFPALVYIAAKIFLKEPCGLIQIITVILTITGVFFTARIPSYFTGAQPVHSTNYYYGLAAALVALFLSTFQVIFLRKMNNIHHAVIMFNLGWIAIIETAIITHFIGGFKLHECGYQGLYIILLGIFSYLTQSTLTLSFQCEFAGSMSTTRAASDIILSFLWQTFLFNDTPDVYSITGAVLVGISFVLVGIHKCATHEQDDA